MHLPSFKQIKERIKHDLNIDYNTPDSGIIPVLNTPIDIKEAQDECYNGDRLKDNNVSRPSSF